MIIIKEYVNRINSDLTLLIEDKRDFLIVDFLIKDRILKTEYLTRKELENEIEVNNYKFKGTL